ncbi:MAG: Bacteroidetes-specific putative rane protein [Bacteroidota bacterium]|nr:Bacteroidetes-specific putative rane protein [Bacteroidota bacterium]
MIKKIFFAFFGLLSVGLYAQQVEDFSLLRENAFVLNPALAGTEGYIHGTATFRKEFLSIDQSPYTAMFAMDGQIKEKHIGLGGYVIHDVTGPTGKTGGSFAFAYNLPIAKKRGFRYTNGEVDHVLSFGAAISVVQYRLDGSQLLVNNQGDPGLYTTGGFKVFPDASFGIYYKWKEQLFAGVSVPQIMGLNVNYRASDGTAEIKKVQHLNILVGGKIAWDKENFSIDPIASFRWVKGAPPQGDVGLRFVIYKVFWVGTNYRSLNYEVFEAGFNVKNVFMLSYSYDFNFSKYSKDVGATHELSISFNIPRSSRVWRGVGPALRF